MRRPFEPRALLDTLRGVDAVVHLAGVVSALRERDYIAANVDGTRMVADAARTAGAAADPHLQPGGGRACVAASAAVGGRSAGADQRLRPQQARGRTRRRACSTACAGQRCGRASSTDRAIARCCRCSRLAARGRHAAGRPSRRGLQLHPRPRSGAGDRRRGRSSRGRRDDLRRASAPGHARARFSRRCALPRVRAPPSFGCRWRSLAQRPSPAMSPGRCAASRR